MFRITANICSVIIFALGALGARPVLAQAGIPYLAEPDAKAEDSRAREAPPPPRIAAPRSSPEPITGKPLSFFIGLWSNRRAAMQRGDHETARKLLTEFVEAKRQAGWPSFFAYGDALAIEAERSLAQGAAERGRKLARAAVAIAPNRPHPHFALARAELAAGGGPIAALRACYHGVRLRFGEPFYLRIGIGNVLMALAAATAFVTSFLALVVIYRHGRSLFHDLRHLLPRAALPAQVVVLGSTLVLLPVFFRYGIVISAVFWLVLFAIYFDLRERLGAAVLLGLLAGFALGLPYLLSHLGYAGSRAQDIYLTVRDAGAQSAAERVRARQYLGPEELYALGLRARWSGKIEEARTWLDRASAIMPDRDLFITAGNVRYLAGDRAGAVAAYEQALAINPDDLVALFNLSRVYYATTEHHKAGELQRRAMSLDLDRVEALNEQAKRARGIYLVDPGVPRRLLDVPLELGSNYWRTVEQLWRFVAHKTERTTFAATAIASIFLIFLLGVSRKVVRPASRCPRCGEAACQRCHPKLNDQSQCGACYRAFIDHTGVDPGECIKQEIKAHRHRARAARARQILSLILAGSCQMLRGAFLPGVLLMIGFLTSALILLWALGVLPELAPRESGPHWFTVGLASLGVASTYVLSLRDGLREER